MLIDESELLEFFEMLLPNRIKEQAPKQNDLVLMLDAESTRFPYELLEDRWSQRGFPLRWNRV